MLPGIPLELTVIPVIVDSKMEPLFELNNFPVVFSIISCPKAPNSLVFGSIYVSVPIPVMLSFTYKPDLYIPFSKIMFKSVLYSLLPLI